METFGRENTPSTTSASLEGAAGGAAACAAGTAAALAPAPAPAAAPAPAPAPAPPPAAAVVAAAAATPAGVAAGPRPSAARRSMRVGTSTSRGSSSCERVANVFNPTTPLRISSSPMMTMKGMSLFTASSVCLIILGLAWYMKEHDTPLHTRRTRVKLSRWHQQQTSTATALTCSTAAVPAAHAPRTSRRRAPPRRTRPQGGFSASRLPSRGAPKSQTRARRRC